MSSSSNKSPVWGTRLGFYLAAVGSAFGLGNLWRFPYVAAENGGGAFVLLYLASAFLIGLPFLIGELLLGKLSRSSLFPATLKMIGERHIVRSLTKSSDSLSRVEKSSYKSLAWASMILNLLVLSYYAVISGWVLHFLIRIFLGFVGISVFNGPESLSVLMNNGWLQILLTGLHLIVIGVIVGKDLEHGLERWVGYAMPVFALLLGLMVYKSLSLDSAAEALRFLIYPDFSKLSISSPAQAIGHVFFTLSIGFGTMVTFGSYLRDESYLPLAGLRVATLDSVISVLAGIVIFPLILMGDQKVIGPDLFFKTVPELFGSMSGGLLFGVGFFLCLYLASLGASIGLLETLVANLRETRRVPRRISAIGVTSFCLLVALLPALSSNLLSFVRIGKVGLLGLWDMILINWALPLVALFISQMVCWKLRQELVSKEFEQTESGSSALLYSHWLFVMRFVATPLIVIALALQAWALFS
ncbi:MAG: sodium-dependent transporter [Bdellovibrionaceae bacterium]|nr:sodium-dependent transporter [Pseudobdellovibrionaceae bacterium]